MRNLGRWHKINALFEFSRCFAGLSGQVPLDPQTMVDRGTGQAKVTVPALVCLLIDFICEILREGERECVCVCVCVCVRERERDKVARHSGETQGKPKW